MDKKMYDNPLRQQCMSIPDLCADQIAGVRKGIEESIPADVLKGCRRIIITGCGDSYVAAKAAIPAFKKFGGKFGNNFGYDRAINLARYVEFDPRYSDSTLVVAVSCSGGPARIQEVLRRANHHGCHTLAVTNNPDSPAGQEAEYKLIVNTPAFPNASPGLRNYYASLVGLYMLAARFGEVTGISPAGTMDEMARAITEYTAAYAPLLEGMDDQMFTLAQTWKDFKSYDFIGDDIQYCTAFFDAAKIVEVAGGMTNVDDSEDWCHVPFFQKGPDKIGTMVIADRFANNKSRIGETISQAAGVGRPVLLVANGTKDDFGVTADINVCTVPEAPEGFPFLTVLMNYIPGAILAGYLSTLTGEPFFRGGGVWNEPGNNTIRTSKIEVL